MTIRVIQWATGTVGIHAVPAIAAHPDLELRDWALAQTARAQNAPLWDRLRDLGVDVDV